jgi:hypothetical protein
MQDISNETSHLVDELVATGRFENRQAVFDSAIRLLRDEVHANGADPPASVSAAEWCARFEAWANSHPVLPYEADDSREKIYEGRGE